MTVRFHRRTAGYYWTVVNGIEYNLIGPDPFYPRDPGYEWTLESQAEGIGTKYFHTMKKAREYLATINLRGS